MRIYKVVLLVFCAMLFVKNGTAQLSATKLIQRIENTGSSGKVTLIQDDIIVKLVDKHLYEEAKQNGIRGYRIRLFSNSGAEGRKEGELMQANFISRYEGIKTEFLFDSPFYLLYVGNFRTQSEAMKFLKEIEPFYPDAFIVRSKIGFPSL